MKRYWRVRPASSSKSRSTSCGVKATKLATASKLWPSSARRSDTGSCASVTSDRAPGAAAPRWPRLAMKTSMPRSTHRRTQDALMFPVPPMNRTFTGPPRSRAVRVSFKPSR